MLGVGDWRLRSKPLNGPSFATAASGASAAGGAGGAGSAGGEADDDIPESTPTDATHQYFFTEKFGGKQKGCKPKDFLNKILGLSLEVPSTTIPQL